MNCLSISSMVLDLYICRELLSFPRSRSSIIRLMLVSEVGIAVHFQYQRFPSASTISEYAPDHEKVSTVCLETKHCQARLPTVAGPYGVQCFAATAG